MFNFQWPWFALLLPLPWLVWRYFSGQERLTPPADAVRPVLLHPALEQLQAGFSPAQPGIAPGSWRQLVLLACAWFFLVLTLMGPRYLEEQAETASRGHDLMLAIDTSGSMKAMDFTLNGEQVSRMAVVKGVAGRFAASRHGDRIGLILFGDQAIMQAPLTLDAHAVAQLLRYAEPGVAGDGTAIGDAITLAVKKLKERPAGSRVLVLVTDGENTAGMAPSEAARLAEKYGVRIYAMGVGSKGKVPFPDAQGNLTYRDDLLIDDEGLTRIATLTGGAYFRATDTQGLERIYREIDALEKTEAATRSTFIPITLYRWPLAAALLALLALAWLGLRRTDSLINLIFGLSVALLVGASGSSEALEFGDPAPNFQLPGTTPDAVLLPQGQVVYLDFWASWCGPCRKSFPWMNAIQAQYRTRGFQVIAINLDNDKKDVQEFLARHPAQFVVAFDPTATLPPRYGVQGMPCSFLIGRDGKLLYQSHGFNEASRLEMEQRIAAALNHQP